MQLKTRDATTWARILNKCGVSIERAAQWGPAFSIHMRDGALSMGEDELDDFLGQVLHECNKLERMQEDLFYKTPGLLMKTWPGRFPTLESEEPYRRSPEALANKVYGGRMGNLQAGDGWRFRGRGPIQLTGRSNYQATGAALGINLVDAPDLMFTPDVALRVTIAWWERNLPDEVMDNLPKVTKRVNGGLHGLKEREALTKTARAVLAVL